MGKYLERRYDGRLLYYIDSNNIALLDHPTGYGFVRYNVSENTWHPWSEAEPYEERDQRKMMMGLTFINDSLGFACGLQRYHKGDAMKDIIWKTTNGGRVWELKLEQIKPTSPHVGLRNISFRNELHGIAVGSYGNMMETTDGGETWEYRQVPEMADRTLFSMEIAWAGDYAILAYTGGLMRLEEVGDTTDVSILETQNINIRQTRDELLIAIEDDAFRQYKISIYDLQGNLVQENSLSSGVGRLFMPISINQLVTGVYLYRISSEGISNGGIAQSGKLMID